MSEAITIALISAVAGIAVTIVAGYLNLVAKNKEATKINKRLQIELSCVNILFNHEFLKTLNTKVDEIFDNTRVDRFLILFAVNGKTSFNYATVCYEKTKKNSISRGAIYRYVRIEVDKNYKVMLQETEQNGMLLLEVNKMPECLLKDIYKSHFEHVNYSMVKFLKRITVDAENDIVIYSTAATTAVDIFTADEQVIIKSAYDTIRHAAHSVSYSSNEA